MEIIRSINKIKNIEQSAVTIGNFDGVHIGHQVLINKTVKIAQKNSLKSVIFTFSNHPVNFFKPGTVKGIITNEQKLNIFKSMGVDITVMVPFDHYMTVVEPREFIENILINRLKAKYIIVGHDFTFAKNKTGNPKFLVENRKMYGFKTEVVKPIKIKDKRISSTYIRKLITSGKMEEIKEYLGREYTLRGKIVNGKHIGRGIGFPTANIDVDCDLLYPLDGIYVTKFSVGGKKYFGATNVGNNPTVNGKKITIETYILNFNKNIYGEKVEVEFIKKIRDEIKFKNLNELSKQLKKDIDYVYLNYVCKTN